MSPDAIVLFWMREHGSLSPEQQQRFRAKDGIVDSLSQLPDWSVRQAIVRHQSLADILASAQQSTASVNATTTVEVRRVPCPTCGAGRDEPCRTKGGSARKRHHAERVMVRQRAISWED